MGRRMCHLMMKFTRWRETEVGQWVDWHIMSQYMEAIIMRVRVRTLDATAI